ncbi:rhodanese-like domain-containing protein [Rhodobacter sp. Har01]|uniref:rhodanese-like domain-containing protein n=1 Tax=Rhodobacter sp. Har01 TaxID=2883999 RepID=UPI001D090736|nr:rhodanese-like domain-containing protein [Rhodobacter sp. Har01]MCB6179194.1 rhodanese-like domain-containing protein [Rhodobacter sp. Har01]
MGSTGRRLVLAALLAVASMAAQAGEVEVKALTLAEMKAEGALVVDIRRPEEWAETGVIEGARLVTFTDPQSFLAQIGPEIADGRDLVLVCRSGRRTGIAAQALSGMIPNRIVSQDGGMSRLIEGGYNPAPAG